MHRNFRRWSFISALVAAVAGLIVAAAAFAAKPIAGKTYTGLTSGRSVNGWKPAVSFQVSSNASKLLQFTWRGTCGPIGPIPPGTPPGWIDPAFMHKVGKINVARNGSFSIKGATQKNDYGPNGSDATITTVTGRFKTRKSATGTIAYTTNGYSANGTVLNRCNGKVSFSATTH